MAGEELLRHACRMRLRAPLVALPAARRPPRLPFPPLAEPDVLRGDQVPQLKWSPPDTGASSRAAAGSRGARSECCRLPGFHTLQHSCSPSCQRCSPVHVQLGAAIPRAPPPPRLLLQTAWCSSWCTKRRLQKTACARPWSASTQPRCRGGRQRASLKGARRATGTGLPLGRPLCCSVACKLADAVFHGPLQGKASQGRLESFFGPAKIVSSTVGKRKEPEKNVKGGAAGGAKKGKLGAMSKGGKK